MTDSDLARFDELYDRAFTRISAYALRRAGPSDAADVVAETFLVAWRRRAEVPTAPNDVPWLFGVARRVLANQRRSAGRRTALSQRLAQELAPACRAPEPDGALEAAFLTLDDDQRELLRLVAWEGLTTGELAIVLGCTPNAAAIRLHRARAALRRGLDPDERPGVVRTLRPWRPTDA